MISVIVYTKNEAANLADCLRTVRWSSDIHILDSGSADDTIAIARALDVAVHHRPFDREDVHKNWALAHIPFKFEWIFQIDADERCSPELAQSMAEAVSNPGPYVGFRFRRRDYYEGKWIRHVQSQLYSLRLFRRDQMFYDRMINAVPRAQGPVKLIAGYLDHYPFSKGLDQWIERHNWYSALEAQQILADQGAHTRVNLRLALSASDFHVRRYHQKRLFYSFPLRPLLKFMLLYVVRGGFLDGRAGFRYTVLQCMYEYWIVLKTTESAVRAAAPDARGATPHIASLAEREVAPRRSAVRSQRM